MGTTSIGDADVLLLYDGARYVVKGTGPVVSPALRWDSGHMEFTYRGERLYTVDDIQKVRRAGVGREEPWFPIHQCRIGKPSLDQKGSERTVAFRKSTEAMREALKASPGSTVADIAKQSGAGIRQVAWYMYQLWQSGKVMRVAISPEHVGGIRYAYSWI